MVKHYCDRCGDLLEDDKIIKVSAKISPYPIYVNEVHFEFCKRCYENAFGCTQQVLKAEEEKRNAEKPYRRIHDNVAEVIKKWQQCVYITDEEGDAE